MLVITFVFLALAHPLLAELALAVLGLSTHVWDSINLHGHQSSRTQRCGLVRHGKGSHECADVLSRRYTLLHRILDAAHHDTVRVRAPAAHTLTLSDTGSPFCEMYSLTMTSYAVKLWKKSKPRSRSSDHFACGLRMNRRIAVNWLPMRASYSSFSCLQASRPTNLVAELQNGHSLPVTPRHEKMPQAL